ncbi:MAG: SulP family inorganic anion transporter [Candidatus Gracilibacteria bacterium]
MLTIKNLKHNWKAGLTVALINIPLSISLAIASGATPTQGLITAIWGGIVASFFASSNYNVFGVAGALSSILLAFVLSNGANGALLIPFVTILSGIIILVIYFLKITKYIILIPSNTLHGFIISVGITIFLSQLPAALGLNDPILHIQTHKEVYLNIIEIFKHIGNISFMSLGIFGVGLSFLMVGKRFFPKFPSVIFLTIIGIIIGLLINNGYLPKNILLLSDIFKELTFKIGEFPFGNIKITSLNDAIQIGKTIFVTSTVVAIIAVLETIISAKAASNIKREKFDKNKEVFGLGIANIASGLFGGLPATAVFIRTALNINSGATRKTSSLLIGIFTLIIGALFFNGYFKFLPYPIISAILVNISLGLIDISLIKKIYKIEKTSFFILVLTTFFAVMEDSIFGILVGTSVSLIIFVRRIINSHVNVSVFRENKLFGKMRFGEYIKEQKENDIILMKFISGLNYLTTESNIERIEKLEKNQTIIFSFSHMGGDIDLDGLEALEHMVEKLHSKDITVYISGVEPNLRTTLSHFHFYKELKKEEKVYDSTSEVLDLLIKKCAA